MHNKKSHKLLPSTISIIEILVGTLIFIHGVVQFVLKNYSVSQWVFTCFMFFLISINWRKMSDKWRDLTIQTMNSLDNAMETIAMLTEKEKESK